MKKPKKKTSEPTSWESVSTWYDKAVGDSGHYYHQKIILPKIAKLLSFKEGMTGSLLDLACGQGILSRYIPDSLSYQGIDISPSLLEAAKEKNTLPNRSFSLFDITKPFILQKKDYDLCTIILAIQNLEKPLEALKNAAKHLRPGGKLLLVMNHPCFRIPKFSSWETTEEVQYRCVDHYLTPIKIPIQANPSLGNKSPITFSFHHPLSSWISYLSQAGFTLENLEEWSSDKKSTGKYAEREDIARREIPLFLTIKAQKN
jgi:SAM-dependent methyltransferase